MGSNSAAMLASRLRSTFPLIRGISSTTGMRQKAMEVEDVGEGARPATAQMGTMLDIGSRSIYNSDQDMFREQVRRWMRERLAPQQVPFEEDGQPSKEIWREMGAQGLLGVSTPAEVGGIGASFLEEAIVAEGCPMPTAPPQPWLCTAPSACHTSHTTAQWSSRSTTCPS